MCIVKNRTKTLMNFVLSPLTELSTGLLTFAQFGHKDITEAKVPIFWLFLQAVVLFIV